MTGSIKDRMALHVLTRAYARRDLVPGATIVEANQRQHRDLVLGDRQSSRPSGPHLHAGVDEHGARATDQRLRCRGRARQQGGRRLRRQHRAGPRPSPRATPDAFLPRQFENADNADAKRTNHRARTLVAAQVPRRGCRRVRRRRGHGRHRHGGGSVPQKQVARRAEYTLSSPRNSPTLRTGHKVGTHRIQGISDEFVPSIVDLDWLDDVVAVDDGDAILMAQRLATELGLGVGISTVPTSSAR